MNIFFDDKNGRGGVVFDTCTDDLGGPAEEMSEQGWDLGNGYTEGRHQLAVYAILMKDRKSDGRLSYSTSTDESGWSETLCETNDLLDHLAVSKDGPRRRGFFRHARCKY
jgi:hypothetical protein